jgi:hypothetical protein
MLRPQEQFDHFSYRAFSPAGLGHVIACRLEFRPAVVDGYRQADASEKREIHQIVADVGDFQVRQSRGALDFFVSDKFVVGALVKKFDSKLFGAMVDCGRGAPGNDADLNFRALEQANSLSIAHVEGFDFSPAVIHQDPAVGQDSVYVEQEEFNSPGFFADCGCDALHGD